MDKSAVFVDAGCLLARGGLVVCGTHRRAELDCAYEPLIEALGELTRGHCDLETLRLYWYDRAPDRIPTPDHLEVGNLPYVKVRLGRIGQDGRQKGVDALIYRARLLRDASRSSGASRIPDEFVRDLRAAFESSVQEVVAEPATGEASLA